MKKVQVFEGQGIEPAYVCHWKCMNFKVEFTDVNKYRVELRDPDADTLVEFEQIRDTERIIDVTINGNHMGRRRLHSCHLGYGKDKSYTRKITIYWEVI